MHPTGRAQLVVDREHAGGLRRHVDVVELEDGHVGEPDAGHPRFRTGSQLEPRRRPRAVGPAQGAEVHVVFPRVPLGLVVSPDALRVHDDESEGASLGHQSSSGSMTARSTGPR